MEHCVLFFNLHALSLYKRLQMKKIGDICNLKEFRDKELLRTFRLHLLQEKAIDLVVCVEKTIMSPTSRFWVTEQRTSIVINKMLRGVSIDNMSETRKEMYTEIHRRVCALKKEHPDWSVRKLVSVVIHQPAPKFYLTVDSAIIKLWKLRKLCREQRRKH